MFEALSNALAAIVGKYAAVIGIVSPALRIGIVIYISLLGYAIMRGAVQYPFREYAYRGCQLAFLYFAVTSLYGSQIGMFALGGLPGQFASALGGADVGGLGGFYDKLAGTGFETANVMRKIAANYQESLVAQSISIARAKYPDDPAKASKEVEARRQEVAIRIARDDRIAVIQVRNQQAQRVHDITQAPVLRRDEQSR